MCIGIPMQVIEADGRFALCEGRGERRRINTALVGGVAPGDWLLVFLGDARERAGYRNLPTLAEADYQWPDIESPEAAAIWAADPFIGIEQALQVALDAESAGLAFYDNVLQTTTDPEIKVLAKEFVEEEAQHVAELERWIALHRSGEKLPLGR